MTFPLGILIAVSALVASILHLKQDATNFWDFVGFICVIGGTLAVAVITIPWQHRRIVLRSVVSLFVPKRSSHSTIVADCVAFIVDYRDGKVNEAILVSGLAGDTLRDGAELMGLGFSKERIHEILEERIHQSFERFQVVANSFRSLAKYPPAFGLAGTVLGLVTLMRSVSGGADAKQTGTMMAIALMATFYGLLVANMIVNPAGEHMLKTANAERKDAEIALHTILLQLEGVTLLEAQEILNSYVSAERRVNMMADSSRRPSVSEAA
jgi:chemotaxis protein MotA